MKTAKDLTREQLERIVDTTQEMFWSPDNDAAGKPTSTATRSSRGMRLLRLAS